MMKPDELQDHITSAYFSLRLGIIVASVALPLVLYFGGVYRGKVRDLLPSISDYYFSNDALLRDWFVGTLCAVGVFLYSYKGFSVRENVALNIAGIFAVLTALNPCVCGDPGRSPSIHGVSAVSFYLAMAYVCLRCAPETLELSDDNKFKATFSRLYRIIGWSLIASPVLAVLASFFLNQFDKKQFFIETLGLLTFAAYWLVKSREMSRTEAEKQAVAGNAMRIEGHGVIKKAKSEQYDAARRRDLAPTKSDVPLHGPGCIRFGHAVDKHRNRW
jgi:hypothetical protein